MEKKIGGDWGKVSASSSSPPLLLSPPLTPSHLPHLLSPPLNQVGFSVPTKQAQLQGPKSALKVAAFEAVADVYGEEEATADEEVMAEAELGGELAGEGAAVDIGDGGAEAGGEAQGEAVAAEPMEEGGEGQEQQGEEDAMLA